MCLLYRKGNTQPSVHQIQEDPLYSVIHPELTGYMQPPTLPLSNRVPYYQEIERDVTGPYEVIKSDSIGAVHVPQYTKEEGERDTTHYNLSSASICSYRDKSGGGGPISRTH